MASLPSVGTPTRAPSEAEADSGGHAGAILQNLWASGCPHADIVFQCPDTSAGSATSPGASYAELRAHKAVVAGASSMLDGLLYGGLCEAGAQRVTLTFPPAAIFKQVLRWIYTGQADVQLSNFVPLRAAASYFLLPRLEGVILRQVAAWMRDSPSAAARVLQQLVLQTEEAALANEDILTTAVMEICFQPRALVHSPVWPQLHPAAVHLLLSCDDFALSEPELAHALLAWGREQAASTSSTMRQVVAPLCAALR
ncbi:BTB/POZ domain-containing protein, partial [archaeon]